MLSGFRCAATSKSKMCKWFLRGTAKLRATALIIISWVTFKTASPFLEKWRFSRSPFSRFHFSWSPEKHELEKSGNGIGFQNYRSMTIGLCVYCCVRAFYHICVPSRGGGTPGGLHPPDPPLFSIKSSVYGYVDCPLVWVRWILNQERPSPQETVNVCNQ